MNKQTSDSILEGAILSLRELGLEVTYSSDRSARSEDDATLTIRGVGRPRLYRGRIKSGVRPALVGPISSLFSAEDQLLITDYVTPPLAEALRERGVQFVDAAGNAFLRRAGLLMFVKGQRPRTPRRVLRNSRVFGASGVKTIFALLSVPELVSAPQRE
ncbi:MAG TPA: hypothetical protein VGQ76_08260, partial [Thermoanaerobaculia bacterium]|nr:hypothetical protein [Thermoanaerobaculia bacterium]